MRYPLAIALLVIATPLAAERLAVSPGLVEQRGRGRTAPVTSSEAQELNVPGVSNVTVEANEAWNDTGIDVQAGDRLTFRATGSIRLSASADDIASPAGANGGRTATDAPIPKSPAGTLIGRVGAQGTPFVIGVGQDGMPVKIAGRLYLGVNDDAHEDNVGTFNVVVTVVR